MLIAHSLAELANHPNAGQPSVVTIGNFDGVHVGHQMILSDVRQRAQELDARSVVVTFDPHPAHVLRPHAGQLRSPLITSLPYKLELLAQTGVHATLVLPFTEDLRLLTARQFAQRILQDGLHTIEIHEGESFRFGHQAEADIAGLTQLGQELGFAVKAHAPALRRGAPVSSSRIRTLLAAGNLPAARALLGRSFALNSTPAKGRGYGTRYAVPTINLATPSGLLPSHGVYVTSLRIGSTRAAPLFYGVTNAGNRPTFGEDSYAIESHLFNFQEVELNEATPLRLTFLKRLRDERRFALPELLKQQIGKDVGHAERFLHLCQHLEERQATAVQ